MKKRIIALCCVLVLMLSLPIAADAVGSAGVFNCSNCRKMTEHSWHYHDPYLCMLICNICHCTSVLDAHFYEVNGAYLVCKYCYDSYRYGPKMPPDPITADICIDMAEAAEARGEIFKAGLLRERAKIIAGIDAVDLKSQNDTGTVKGKCAPDDCGKREGGSVGGHSYQPN